MASAVVPDAVQSLFKEPALTPPDGMMPFAQSTTVLIFFFALILPGLILSASAPALADARQVCNQMDIGNQRNGDFLFDLLGQGRIPSETATLIIYTRLSRPLSANLQQHPGLYWRD
jgi:hypothetical protein